ncbi:uncharacterized protein (TIGR01655 family) [Lactococcus lactis]|uniref:Uncharacterized protein (TIGR01655 family) n=1 Tax=Lactococcus lactis TaxID=1358 RepID=A0AAW5TLQ5_9LACT|nr:uncharacterized protein (TIGR01655 family) [Lactococcus lactis]
MKKIFFGLATVLLVILIGSGYTWYKVNYGGTAYYVQINKNGKEEEKLRPTQVQNINNMLMI